MVLVCLSVLSFYENGALPFHWYCEKGRTRSKQQSIKPGLCLLLVLLLFVVRWMVGAYTKGTNTTLGLLKVTSAFVCLSTLFILPCKHITRVTSQISPITIMLISLTISIYYNNVSLKILYFQLMTISYLSLLIIKCHYWSSHVSTCYCIALLIFTYHC